MKVSYLGTEWDVCIYDINLVQDGGQYWAVVKVLMTRERVLFNDIANFLVYIAPKYDRIMLSWGNRSTLGETCPSAILSATNPT